MNLAYLEFIGAIEVERSPVAVTPAISFDKPIGKESVKQFTYLDTRKHKSILDLERALEKAKKEQDDAIKYVYNEIVKIAKETDSRLRKDYISHELSLKMPVAIVRDGILCYEVTGYNRGDVIFLEDKIVVFMDRFTVEFLERLKKKFSPDIRVDNGILSRDPMEVQISMKRYLE